MGADARGGAPDDEEREKNRYDGYSSCFHDALGPAAADPGPCRRLRMHPRSISWYSRSRWCVSRELRAEYLSRSHTQGAKALRRMPKYRSDFHEHDDWKSSSQCDRLAAGRTVFLRQLEAARGRDRVDIRNASWLRPRMLRMPSNRREGDRDAKVLFKGLLEHHVGKRTRGLTSIRYRCEVSSQLGAESS